MGPSSNERRYRPVPQSFAQASASPSSAMGQPSTAATSRLSAQHERLILELLPFKDANLFHDWLSSVYVRGSWIEFCRDFLTDNHLSPEPDKDKTAQAAKDAINSRKPQFLLYHPDKTGWNDQDHHVRFIVSVVADNMLKSCEQISRVIYYPFWFVLSADICLI